MMILDCTLRDGGYYTNWDFSQLLVAEYLQTMEQMPIDCVEIGYRSPKLDGYYGEYFYLPESTMQFCRSHFSKKISAMINAKDVSIEAIEDLISPCKSYIDIFRLATAPTNIPHSLALAKKIKQHGFQVALNIMYLSKWGNDCHNEVFNALKGVNADIVDYVCAVDSYGSIYPEEMDGIIANLRNHVHASICFHGHDNLELSFANTLRAMANQCAMVDCTINGMGRGAGNLKTELLLTYLSRHGYTIDFSVLTPLVEKFVTMQKTCGWGTNIPYMISGANSLPQKDIMAWMSLHRYTVMQIVNMLMNDSQTKRKKESHTHVWHPQSQSILVIGGGPSVLQHQEALRQFMMKQNGMVVFSSCKYLSLFKNCGTSQRVICLVGREGKRLELNMSYILKDDMFLASPNVDTYLPASIVDRTYYLSTNSNEDSPLFIALSSISAGCVYLAGFDGYADNVVGADELMAENQTILNGYKDCLHIASVLPTRYENIEQLSIYALI